MADFRRTKRPSKDKLGLFHLHNIDLTTSNKGFRNFNLQDSPPIGSLKPEVISKSRSKAFRD
ncbi:hypothetical protein MTR_0217s0070 [Medicago truncatula]|uniref:Uncharacterized protein n=1 Tax=Medicago truncatula TaxID=3880 RepID=A0A072TGS3_MEDTR|nr:hypothetical protein MTR_0217s0070 [Medicago truncatula]